MRLFFWKTQQAVTHAIRRSNAAKTPARYGNQIVARWIETGDQRMPLACVWTSLQSTNPDADDAHRRKPATRLQHAWRAFTLLSPSSL